MIDFRYHLVSIVSVFLALAVGVVIGTTALNGPVVGDLRHQVSDLKGERSTLQKQNKALSGQVGHGNDFAAAIAPAAVAGKLAGEQVLVVTAPGASAADTAAVVNLLTDAGGTVTTQLALAASYTDPNHATDLQQYAASGIAPAGFTLPKSDDAGTVAGALLSDVLMAPRDPKAERPTDTERQAVLSGFVSQGLLSLRPATAAPATTAIVVAGAPPAGATAAAQSHTVTALASALQSRGKAVVIAGTAASDGNAGIVGTIRQSPALADQLSTVDDVDSPSGQLAAVLALKERLGGPVGQYGVQSDAEATAPGSTTQ